MAKYRSQAEVIAAIRSASDKELRALAQISKQIGGLKISRPNSSGAGSRQPRANDVGLMIERALKAQNGPNNGSAGSRSTGGSRTLPAQVSLQTVRKSRQAIGSAVDKTIEAATDAVVETIKRDLKASLKPKPARKRRTQEAASAALAESGPAARRRAPRAPGNGQYYDAAGRLRDSSGRFIKGSGGGNGGGGVNRRADDDDEQKQTNALLRKMAGAMMRGAANAVPGEETGNVTAAAGGMGIFWQSSKEMLNVAKTSGENAIKLTQFLNKAQKGARAGGKSILRGFSANDARASVKEAKELATKEAQKENHQDQEETHTNQEKQIELLKLLVDKEGKGGGESGGGLLSSLGKGFGALLGGGGLVGAYRKLRGRFGGKGKVGGTAIDEAGALKGEAKAAGKAGKKVAGEAAEEGVEKLAKGSLVKGGEKALEKGGLKAAAKIGLRAIPILGTIAGVGIDAIGGWNDEENLKKNFGDNITTGDRAAQSLANVMDMGGLVSGASNLISAGADALGFEKVAKTFAMDGSNELAKSMGKIFDGSDDKADDRNKSVVDKLSDIVDAVSTLSGGMIAGAPQMPGMMGVNAIAQQALEDNKAITAGAVNTEIVGGANDSMNAYRKRQGWSYNPIARTTLTNTSRNGKYASAGTLNLANNNFGNIRAGDFAAARGGVKTSSGFAGFATPEEGIRAAGDLVLRYNAQGVTTLSQIVSKWAPPNENDTQSYIKRVGAQLGLGPNDKIDATDPVVVSKLISAMSTVEGSSMSMTQADIQKSLGTVKNGNYVGGWTDSTANELGKTAEGKAILANNTGANVVKSPTMVEKGVGMVKKAAAMINTGAVKAMPGLSYSAANAGLGLSPVQKATIAPALNGDALVNSSIAALSTYKPASSMTATPVSGGGIFSGAIGDIFKSATQGISGGDIISEATKGLSPEWSRAISPLTNAAGGGIDQVLNLGRNAIGGWLNGSPTTQRTVTDLSRSGVSSTVSPDSASAKTQENQLSTLEEIASYLEQILGIQKKAPAGNPDATKPGPQPGPTGEIPMSSRSSLISDIVRRQH